PRVACCGRLGMVECVGSGVMMEMGEGVAEKGLGKVGGKQLCTVLIVPISFTLGTESEELKITSITDIYKHFADGVTLGTRFTIYGMVIGINLDKDWKYI
nr:replication protein A 70 kDa DNA-binding subunit B [Tanacetum cinerariifolium]